VKARALFGAVVLLLAAQVVAWASSDASSAEIEGTRMSRAARRLGCRTICTHCPSRQVCPHNCVVRCPPNTVPCGPSACQNGQVCCNESCGICTPPGGVCTPQACSPPQQCVENALCIRGFHWSPRKCMCIPDTPPPQCVDTVLCIRGLHWSPTQCMCVPDVPGQCATDADCRLFSDYCTGCDCRALSTGDPDPTCSGPGVRCLADPCMNRMAICVNGRCAQSSNPAPAPRTPRGPHAPHAPHAPSGPHTPGLP
jgi:hypothetical protein